MYISKAKWMRKLKQAYNVDLGIKLVLTYNGPYTCCWLVMNLTPINLWFSYIIHNVISPMAQGLIMVTDHSLLSHFTLGGILYCSRGNSTLAIYSPHFPLKNTFFVYMLFGKRNITQPYEQ